MALLKDRKNTGRKPGAGRAAKKKGSKWERDVAEIFRNRLGSDDIKRGLGQARSGHEVSDVVGVPGLWIECKVGKRTAPKLAMKQATKALEASKLEDTIPIAVCKDDRERPTVMMYLDDFLDLKYGKVEDLIADNMSDTIAEEVDENIVEACEFAVDMKGVQCITVGCIGCYVERDITDDLDGVLHCDVCGDKVKRYLGD